MRSDTIWLSLEEYNKWLHEIKDAQDPWHRELSLILPFSLLRARQKKLFFVVDGRAGVFSIFFPCYYKENPFKNNACGNHKSEVPRKTRLYKTHLYLIWHRSNKAKTVVHGLDSLPHPKGNKREEKKIETDRWIQIPLIWVLTLRGSQINQWVRERGVRCNPEDRWQQLSVCLPVFWAHQQGMRSSPSPEKAGQDGGPPENHRASSIWLHFSGAGSENPGTGFYLYLLRCESMWIVTETCNGKTQEKPGSLGKIINNLIHQRSLMVSL